MAMCTVPATIGMNTQVERMKILDEKPRKNMPSVWMDGAGGRRDQKEVADLLTQLEDPSIKRPAMTARSLRSYDIFGGVRTILAGDNFMI